MTVVALDAIESVGARVVVKLGEELQTKIDALGQQLVQVERTNADNLNSALAGLQADLAGLESLLNGADTGTLARLNALLNDEEKGTVARFEALFIDRMEDLDERLKARLAQADVQSRQWLEAYGKTEDERLKRLDVAVTAQIARVHHEIVRPGIRQLREVLDDAKRAFVRGTLLLLNLAGFLILLLTLETSASSNGLRAVLLVVFFIISCLFWFSDSLLNAFLGVKGHHNSSGSES